MANDREVLREVWDGRLPIKFSIGEEDRGKIIKFLSSTVLSQLD